MPSVGIVVLSLAALNSLAVNHVIVHEAHQTKRADRAFFREIDKLPDPYASSAAYARAAVSAHLFSPASESAASLGALDVDKPRPARRDKFNCLFALAVPVWGALTLVLIVVAIFVPVITNDYGGALGLLLEFLQAGADQRTLSLWSIGSSMQRSSDGSAASTLLIAFFQALYMGTVCVMPIVHVVLYLVLWLRPLTVEGAETLLFWCRVASYWASLEVFALG